MSDPPGRGPDGYRRSPGPGPAIRSDIVDVYVFRRCEAGIEFLQLRRARPPMAGDWHPIMGHIEAGETAAACARRELAEEVGLTVGDPALAGFWQLEQVHPYFLAEIDAIVLSARFAAEVRRGWTPRLNDENEGERWVGEGAARDMFVWPGQKAAAAEIVAEIARPGSLAGARLRLDG